ncbi:MAG: TRAM domain-containing protein, partial [Treponema sp.]|nr:TRAM domain-containing protein [Treponema sp.]
MNYVIIADKMIFGSDCMAKIDGKNVFVPYAVPGEKLEVSITDSSRDFCRAEIVSVIEPSEHRVTPSCPYYGKCGGCSMMHIDEGYQRTLRKEVLKAAF